MLVRRQRKEGKAKPGRATGFGLSSLNSSGGLQGTGPSIVGWSLGLGGSGRETLAWHVRGR